MKAKALGFAGEKIAANFLKTKGYEIVRSNFTVRGGEIDLIVQKEKLLIFVEVKTRTSASFGEGNESITRFKRNRIHSAISQYMFREKQDRELDYRVDIVEINLDSHGVVKDINHFEDIEL